MGWREEIDVVLQAWVATFGPDRGGERWQRVGAVQPGLEPGVYLADTRALDLTPDQAENLRLAGPEDRNGQTAFRVMQATFEGQLARLRVAEFAVLDEPYLWRRRQEPALLVKSLRDGLAALEDAGLANLLARGEVGGTPAAVSPPPGWQPAQQQAYQACLGKGLWLVWGPPGTGKTRVIRGAVSDLIAAGKRVLLVSGTNIAVDNALDGVVKERRHGPADIVRVGKPQLATITTNPDVCLNLKVEKRLAEVEEQRRKAATDLLEMTQRQALHRTIEARLEGFDPMAYKRAVALLATPGCSVDEVDSAVTQCESQAEKGLQAIARVTNELQQAQVLAAEADPYRSQWAEIKAMEDELATVETAARMAERRSLLAQKAADDAEGVLAALSQPSGKVRLRDRRSFREAQELLDNARADCEPLRAAAVEGRRIADAFRRDTEGAVSRLTAATPLSREEIQHRDTLAAQAATRKRAFETAQLATLARLTDLRDAQADAAAATKTIDEARRNYWPNLHARAAALRENIARDAARRQGVEQRHTKLQDQYESLAKDAEGEIIKEARLVATTLAKFRLEKVVLDGPYDVVLIDEVGAATLPEVLLAVAKASQCAVLLGDFMQLGPILPTALEDSDRKDIQRWLVTDPFRHCGITTLAEAVSHPSCLVLDTQHRFGPNIMRLANLLAYDGLLKAGGSIRTHDPSDPEIVLVDTDGLHELAQIHRVSPTAGWWAAGLLLSQALVDLHQENGEITGVITPYAVQAEATLEALRDMESGGRPLADVGTAHRFQGREFPVVVFDTVESLDESDGWIGQASLLPGSGRWQRKGVRVFNVATTRAQHRLYVIASRERVRDAKPGTALGNLGTMLRDGQVRSLQATSMVTPTGRGPENLGPETKRLAEVLARHVTISDIHDERSFYQQFELLISQAQESIWLWSAWVASRVRTLLPLLEAAVDRGVRVTVFVRDPSDQLMRKDRFAEALAALRAAVPNVVEVHGIHEKVVVIDDHTVMLGSLNALSQNQSQTREVMITMQGRHWARKLLNSLHAEEFSRPPRCAACHGQQVDLRRATDGSRYWRCYNPSCPDNGKGRYRAWIHPVTLK